MCDYEDMNNLELFSQIDFIMTELESRLGVKEERTEDLKEQIDKFNEKVKLHPVRDPFKNASQGAFTHLFKKLVSTEIRDGEPDGEEKFHTSLGWN